MSPKARSRLAAYALLGLVVAGFVLFRPVYRVEVRLPGEGGRLVDSALAGPDDLLCMRYIHSVERTPVEGWFAPADKGGFRAVRTKTTGTGTGLPNVVPDDRVRTEGKWLIVDEGGKYLPEIPFYYLPLNRLRIEVGGKRLDLEGVPAGSRLRITSRTRPIWRWLVSRIASL